MSWLLALSVVLAVYLISAYLDNLQNKSREELEQILASDTEVLFYHSALHELQKRGFDIERYVGLFPDLIASENQARRETGWFILKMFYPFLTVNVDMDRRVLRSCEKSRQITEILHKKIADRQAYQSLNISEVSTPSSSMSG